MRKIGLDVGDKTVGIAVSDPLGFTAQGIMTLERVGIRKDTTKILEMVKEYQCDTIVIGLPKKLDGTDSIQTEKVYEFKNMLENKMRSTGIKDVSIVWQDERLTTVMAERVLIEADVSRAKRKKVIDIKASEKNTCMVFATKNGEKVTFLVSLTDDVVERGYNAGKMIKDIAAAAGGGGGGKADMAQAGAKDASKIKDAFEVAKNLLS